MGDGETIEQRLRYRILGLLHAGRLHPGERLPSIRQVAREEGVDHRAVADAYRALQDEGLVEVRPGSGVYLADGETVSDVPGDTVSWLAEVLAEGWRRRLPRHQVGSLLERCASTPLRCACVESNLDHMTALSAELESDFSLEVVPVRVRPDGEPVPLERARLEGADLVAATVFHGEVARAVAAAAGKPFVLLRFDPDLTAEVDRLMRERPVIAVMADPAFAARGEAYLAVTSHRGRVRYVLADRLREEGVDPHAPGVLVTRAARRALGMEEYHLLPPPMRVISPASARELSWAMVRVALERTTGA